MSTSWVNFSQLDYLNNKDGSVGGWGIINQVFIIKDCP